MQYTLYKQLDTRILYTDCKTQRLCLYVTMGNGSGCLQVCLPDRTSPELWSTRKQFSSHLLLPGLQMHQISWDIKLVIKAENSIVLFQFSCFSQPHPLYLPSTTCSPNSVHILLHVTRKVIVEHMRDVMNIQSTGRQVSRHQDTYAT